MCEVFSLWYVSFLVCCVSRPGMEPSLSPRNGSLALGVFSASGLGRGPETPGPKTNNVSIDVIGYEHRIPTEK